MTGQKQQYECTLHDFQALHLEAARGFDKKHHLFASHVYLESGFSQVGVTTSLIMLVSHQQYNFVLSERHLALFRFCCEVNANIN